MGIKLENLGNRIGNTAMIAPRAIGTGVNTVGDLADTIIAVPKDILDITGNTINKIKDVFINPRKEGKWYQRVGNIVLSPIVATGTAIEGAVRTAVTPVVNGSVNIWNTVKNTAKNGRKSTFGRLFSKKPISDFSYDKLNTANVISKDKNRFSRLQFGKTGNKSKTRDGKKEKLEVPKNESQKKKNEKGSNTEKNNKSKSHKQTDLTTDNGKTINTHVVVPVITDKEVDQTDSKVKEPKEQGGEKSNKLKSEKGRSEVSENKSQKEPNKKELNVDEKNPEKEVNKEQKTHESIDFNNKPTKVPEFLNSKNFNIKYNPDTEKCGISGNTINLGTKEPSNNDRVPMHRNDKEFNVDRQISHNLCHELTHAAIQDNQEASKPLMELLTNLEGQGRHLSVTSQKDTYKTHAEKAEESFCELFALYCVDKKDFNNYLKFLVSDDDKESKKRNNLGLSKISDIDLNNIKTYCENFENTLKSKQNIGTKQVA